MHALVRAALFVAAIMWHASSAPTRAQSAPTASREPGSITGRVTLNDERGAPGIAVLLLSEFSPRSRPVARAMTDVEGRYRMTGVPPGHYTVLPTAPAYVVSGISGSWPPGKPVNVPPGETVEDVDFNVTRGGVITGRVTDANDRPVTGEHVTVSPADGEGRPRSIPFYFQPGMNETDDRGVYRIYGLPAGLYRVSVGVDKDGDTINRGRPGRTVYARTFHPGTTEESQAKVVEVASGGETTDVDIKLGGFTKTFKASGRVVDAETGRPVPQLNVTYGSLYRDSKSIHNFAGAGVPTNSRGEFQIEGVLPGRYAAFAVSLFFDGETDWYSDPAAFEITDSDVSGLEVKLRRGASLSGTIVVEGTNDRAVLSQLPRLLLHASQEDREELSAPNWGTVKINPDGSFLARGLRAGKTRIMMPYGGTQPKGFVMLRVERNGVALKESFDVAVGEQVTGLRVVLAHGNGVIRGQLKVENGTLPEGARLRVFARRLGGSEGGSHRPSEVDTRGRFMIEGLAAGDYEIILAPFIPGSARLPPVRQTVTVSGVGETAVTLTFDLSAKPREGAP